MTTRQPDRRGDDPRIKRIEEIVEEIRTDQKQIYRLMYGADGRPGLIVEHDRVKQTLTRWKASLAVLWAAAVTAVVAWLNRGGG